MNGLVIDTFAGGGGASLGIAWATGRAPDVAINHDASALAMHAANHPSTRHLHEDVWKADPRKVTKGRKVALLWASPDCKHFSRAKGGKPLKKEIRSLAWVVVKWAAEVKPAIIVLENVREFEDWGPLKGDRPDPARKGWTFNRFVGLLRARGYRVEWRQLNAADFGAPTHRRRLFLIARRDGLPIEWPEPTHGDPKKLDNAPLFVRLKPWRTAAECIDWSIPCPSIFDRNRPLAEKTMRRIALGIKRYVLDAPRPFIVHLTHDGERRTQDLGEPLPTVTGANRGEMALVAPTLLVNTSGHPGARADEPLCTVTTGGHHAVVAPVIARICQSGGNGKYCNGADEPVTTLVSKAEHLLVAPTLIQTGYGEREGQAPRVPGLDKPLGTAVSGCKHALVAAFLARHFGGMVGCELPGPIPTVTAKDHHSLVAANLVHLNHGDKQWSGADEPLRAITATGKHAALVYSFLVKYFGTAIGVEVDSPAPTLTGKDRFGLVTVTIDGQLYVIADIGMRMLTPRELARAQGFPDTYILTGTKTSRVAKIGNSVCPHVAAAIVRANCAVTKEVIRA